jgi:hypothetical protein
MQTLSAIAMRTAPPVRRARSFHDELELFEVAAPATAWFRVGLVGGALAREVAAESTAATAARIELDASTEEFAAVAVEFAWVVAAALSDSCAVVVT